jgi:hypothetical protein
VGRAEVEAAGGRLMLIPLVEGHSTTGLVQRATERELTPHGPESVPAPHLTRVPATAAAARTHVAQDAEPRS